MLPAATVAERPGSGPRIGREPPSPSPDVRDTGGWTYWRSVRSRFRRMKTPSFPLVTTMIPLSKNG